MELNDQSLMLIVNGQYQPTNQELRKMALELLGLRKPLLVMVPDTYRNQVYKQRY